MGKMSEMNLEINDLLDSTKLSCEQIANQVGCPVEWVNEVVAERWDRWEDVFRHGGPRDRGRADAYYWREADPHYYVGDTYSTPKVEKSDMTEFEIEQYMIGYNENTSRKDWG
jgi:hypothetical protein